MRLFLCGIKGCFIRTLRTPHESLTTWKPEKTNSTKTALHTRVRRGHFTLRLRDQRKKWMQDGCKSLHVFIVHGIEWIMLNGHLDYFQRPPLGGRPNTKPPGDHGTLNAHNRCFIWFHHVWRSAKMILFLIQLFWNLIKLAFGWGPCHIWLHTALEDPWPH
jgi:hypothetical protein